jgi:hypothetical protein
MLSHWFGRWWNWGCCCVVTCDALGKMLKWWFWFGSPSEACMWDALQSWLISAKAKWQTLVLGVVLLLLLFWLVKEREECEDCYWFFWRLEVNNESLFACEVSGVWLIASKWGVGLSRHQEWVMGGESQQEGEGAREGEGVMEVGIWISSLS